MGMFASKDAMRELTYILLIIKNFIIMAFYKKIQMKVNGLWYPQSVTVGKPVTTDQVADKLAALSTVTRGDAYAIMKNLGGVLGDFMANGRTVKLDGIGTFYYTASARKQGVENADEVKATLINGVRVRFIPEVHRDQKSQVTTRSMIDNNIFWEEWGGSSNGSSNSGSTDSGNTDNGSTDSGNSGDTTPDSDLDQNPFG